MRSTMQTTCSLMILRPASKKCSHAWAGPTEYTALKKSMSSATEELSHQELLSKVILSKNCNPDSHSSKRHWADGRLIFCQYRHSAHQPKRRTVGARTGEFRIALIS